MSLFHPNRLFWKKMKDWKTQNINFADFKWTALDVEKKRNFEIRKNRNLRFSATTLRLGWKFWKMKIVAKNRTCWYQFENFNQKWSAKTFWYQNTHPWDILSMVSNSISNIKNLKLNLSASKFIWRNSQIFNANKEKHVDERLFLALSRKFFIPSSTPVFSIISLHRVPLIKANLLNMVCSILSD